MLSTEARHNLCGRNIGVQSEQICLVIPGLDLAQPLQVVAERGAYLLRPIILGNMVDIYGPLEMRLQSPPKFTHPCYVRRAFGPISPLPDGIEVPLHPASPE